MVIPVGASLLAKASFLAHRGASFAGKPAPTGFASSQGLFYLPVIIGRFSPCSLAQSIAI
ncbi:hypothetical protein ELQ88_04235 [Pseudomonas sp. MPC6]|nr:hypothetical protein ELQ88_04235 [Pseudomonas sp. MPC6]